MAILNPKIKRHVAVGQPQKVKKMKMGMRKPSIKRSVRARTTGKLKRAAKRTINPTYGKKGIGVIKHPERAIKGAVYKRTTVGVSDVVGHPKKGSGAKREAVSVNRNDNLGLPTIHDGSGHTYEESLEYAKQAIKAESGKNNDGLVLGGCAVMVLISIAFVAMWLSSCMAAF